LGERERGRERDGGRKSDIRIGREGSHLERERRRKRTRGERRRRERQIEKPEG